MLPQHPSLQYAQLIHAAASAHYRAYFYDFWVCYRSNCALFILGEVRTHIGVTHTHTHTHAHTHTHTHTHTIIIRFKRKNCFWIPPPTLHGKPLRDWELSNTEDEQRKQKSPLSESCTKTQDCGKRKGVNAGGMWAGGGGWKYVQTKAGGVKGQLQRVHSSQY